MASADEILPTADCCEICGGALGDEVVIQEFADGSLARLCPECAAGADLEGATEAGLAQAPTRESIWPDEREPVKTAATGDIDPLEMTRELLMPVTDLITLQGEMQAALERLAASLERFAAEMIFDSQDKTAVENRLQMLERELDKTRSQLSQTEFLLTAGVTNEAETGTPTNTLPPLEVPAVSAPTTLPEVRAAEVATPSKPGPEEPALHDTEFALTPEAATSPEATAAPAAPVIEPDTVTPAASAPAAVTPAAPLVAPPSQPLGPEPDSAAVAAAPQGGGARTDRLPTFRIDEVQAAQRYYNESPFTGRVREVRLSLGKPKANLTRLPGPEPRAIVTIAWDIVWYQYLINLQRDLPHTVERVTLHREGMDLDELAFYFKEKNAVVNDDGRLDASELEVKLLSDPEALITEMSPEEVRLLEDATEEIWDQRTAPEFKWDD